MKLLFDQNMSPRLVQSLGDLFPGSMHVQSVGLARALDERVWNFAREHVFLVMTKDVDFVDRSALEGHPPKIVWIRLGNCTTLEIESALRRYQEQIEAFNADPDLGVLTVLG